MIRTAAIAAILLAAGLPAWAQAPAPAYDEPLAKTLGADDMGMRRYVLVILKTGPNRIPIY